MKFATFAAVLAAGALSAGAASAAQIFNIEVWLQGPVTSSDNWADADHVPTGEVSVTFDWTGPINWSDTSAQNSTPAGGYARNLLDGYDAPVSQLSNFVGHNGMSYDEFLDTSLTIAGDNHTTFFRISTRYTSASPISGSFTHDDGATIYVDGNLVAGSAPETSAVTQDYLLPGGMHDLTVYYVTGNGTPSILSFNPGVTTFTGGVPEPGTWALMLTGFFGAGSLLRRRRAATA